MFGEMARMLWLRDSLRMLSKSSNSDAGRKDNLLLLRSRLSRLLSKPLKAPGFRFPIRQLWKSSSLTLVSKNPWSWTVWMGLFRRLVKLIHLKFWKEFFVITLMEFSFRINLSSFNFIFEKLSSMFSILLLDKSRVFSDFMLEMAIKGIFPRRLLARSSCDRTGTPFWKAIEWIFMMLLRLRSSLNNCFRFQNTPTLTQDNHNRKKAKSCGKNQTFRESIFSNNRLWVIFCLLELMWESFPPRSGFWESSRDSWGQTVRCRKCGCLQQTRS